MVEIPQRRASSAIIPYPIIFISPAFAILIALSGYFYYRNQKEHIKKNSGMSLPPLLFPSFALPGRNDLETLKMRERLF
jgi:hypothetical protein